MIYYVCQFSRFECIVENGVDDPNDVICDNGSLDFYDFGKNTLSLN